MFHERFKRSHGTKAPLAWGGGPGPISTDALPHVLVAFAASAAWAANHRRRPEARPSTA
jgi:hypothetical protein